MSCGRREKSGVVELVEVELVLEHRAHRAGADELPAGAEGAAREPDPEAPSATATALCT